MTRCAHLLLLLTSVALALPACGGGGGGGGPPPPAPTLTSVGPVRGSTSGGTMLTLTGTGFTGPASATVGGGAAASVMVVNATTITCVTPPGLPGPVAVSVTTPGGTDVLAASFTYVAPVLYGADGKTGPTVGAPPGNLYTINRLTAATTTIGPIAGPNGVTGMAMAPDGTMWISECTSAAANDTVGTINLATAVPTFVGNTGLGGGLADMTFVGSVLLGHGAAFNASVATVNTTTGVGTVLAGGPECCGNGIAADALGTVYLATAMPGPANPNLYRVNPVTGVATLVGPITGLTHPRVNAMAFLENVLYAVNGDFAGNNILGTINVGTAAFTPIGPLLGTIDAIEGSVK